MKTLKKLRKVAKTNPRARNLLKWERLQAHQNYVKGYYKGLKVEADKYRALWFWIGTLAGGVMGFYFASLYFLAKYCG